ncbi:hypothetical protein JCM10449v2_007563 [Rhodotorula kratochvilovae]
MAGLERWLGLSPRIRHLALAALLSNALLVVCWLVLINAGSPFILSSLLQVPADRTGAITGRLLLADELTALALYLPAGALGDKVGVKCIAALGHVLVAAAFVAYVSARAVGELVAARVLFAVGGGALVTTLSSMMSTLSALPSEADFPPPAAAANNDPDERSALLDGDPSVRRGSSASSGVAPRRHESARLAGVLGFASGLGALLAVFGFLRLPTLLTRLAPEPNSPEALEQALRRTFYLAAAVAALEGAFLAAVLPGKTGREERGSDATRRDGIRRRLRKEAGTLVEGFRLAGKSGDVALGYAASFASRAQTIVVTAYIPLLVNRYFLDHDLCGPNTLVDPARDSCRQAYILASILTGVIQLLSLLLSPLVGLLSSSPRLSSFHPQALALALSFLLGAFSFLGLALLPPLGDGDPRSRLSWLYAMGVGAAQAAGIVLSLALVTTGRGALAAKEGREVAGALSGAYGFSGGLGILAIGSGAGFFFDRFHGAPFIAVAAVDALVAAGAAVL